VSRRTPTLLAAALAAALAALPACRRSGAAAPPERWLSARTAGALVVPELERAGREAATLLEAAATFPGAAASAGQVRAALTAQLGLDPLDPKALARAGVDPTRGAALGYEPPAERGGPIPVLVLPVRDAGALEETLAGLARDRLGAPVRTTATQGGVRVVTFRFVTDSPAVLTLALLGKEKVAALSPTPAGAEVAVAALTRPAAESLAEAPAWRALRAALGDRYALLAGAVPPSPALPPALKEGLAAGVAAEAGALRLGLAVRPSSGAAALRASGDARPRLRALTRGAALALRWDGDPAELGRRVLALVPPHDREWLAAHGLELQHDLFDLLAPGCAASVSLSPKLDLTDLSGLAVRADPLRLVRFELLAEVKDEEAARRALARLPALAAALAEPVGGTPAAAAGQDGRAGRIATPSGELAWKLDGKRLAMAGGPPGALDPLLARAGGQAKGQGYAAPTQASAAALEGGLGGAVLDPRSLARSVRELPEEAFGSGPTGFVLRSMAERFLEPAERLSAVSVRAELAGEVLKAELVVEAPPPGKEAAR
jgi:hypothetical protein